MKKRSKSFILLLSVICLLFCSVGMPQAVFAEGEEGNETVKGNDLFSPDAPCGLGIKLLNENMGVLSWTGNAPQYEVYIRAEGENYRLLDTLTGTTSRLIKKLSTAKRYYV